MSRPAPLLSDDIDPRAAGSEARRPAGLRGRTAGLLDRWLASRRAAAGTEGAELAFLPDVCDYERRLRGLDLLLDVQSAYTGLDSSAPPGADAARSTSLRVP